MRGAWLPGIVCRATGWPAGWPEPSVFASLVLVVVFGATGGLSVIAPWSRMTLVAVVGGVPFR